MVRIFENAQKKLLTAKTAKMVFFMVNNFFLWNFKITNQKNICESIVFKAESKAKHKKKIVGGFSSKSKNALFPFSGIQNSKF